MILILVIIPLFWLWLLELKLDFKEKLLFGSSFFWLIITPIIWALNKFGNYLVTPQMFWFLVSLISLVLFIFKMIKTKGKLKICLPKIKLDWSLLIIIIVFALIHIIFYRFYVTMPESDGYTNILRIEKMMETGNIDYQYRPLFYVAMTVLGQVTKIDMYQIHVVWMVILSAMYLLAMSIFIDRNKIKNLWIKLLILFSGLAVPVVNMEIDFFRPQSLYLLIFPVIFCLEQKNKNYLALLVSLIGLGYHQFFIFPVIVLGIKIFFGLNKFKKGFVFGIVLLLGMVFYEKMILYLPVNRIFESIGQVNKWRWWFLDSYQTVPDNVEMGWPGFSGAAKYYGYYFGPLMLFCLGIIALNLKKFKSQKYWLLMIGFLLIISEVLPRLNVIYLPERFPLLIDITVLLLIPFLFQKIKINKIFLVGLILVGLLGSIYIAFSKGSLTNREELVAAKWIKNNTSKDAIFLTQETNKPMVMFFARRKFLNPGEIFFNEGVSNNFLIKDCKNCYILYSSQKNTGLRSERKYWREYNYEGIDLNEFNLKYKKIYDKDKISVWKIE